MDFNLKSKEQLKRELTDLRKTLTHIIAVEIDNLKADNALKSQKEFNNTVLSSLNAHIAVLNEHGEIIAVNKSWESFARENKNNPSINFTLGSNLLELYQDNPSNKTLQQMAEGFEAIINGGLEALNTEHLYETSTGKCWYLVKTSPMGLKYGGAVLSRVDITTGKINEEALKEQNDFIINVFESLSHPFYVIDVKNHTVKMANSAARISPQAPISTCYSLIYNRSTPCEGTNHPCPLNKVVKTEQPCKTEHVYYDNNGKLKYIENHGYPVFDQQGQVTQMIVYTLDITERKMADKQLKLAGRVFSNTLDGIVITDTKSVIQSVNPAFTKITGYTPEEAIGQSLAILKSGYHDPGFYKNMWTTLLTDGQWQGEIWNKRKDGVIYPGQLNISSIKNDLNEMINFVCVFTDISKLKQSEQRYAHLAYHDSLTGLSNRLQFQDRFQQALERVDPEETVALMFIDLNRFKFINDTLGHTIGDKVLKEIAERLNQCRRDDNILSRWGGDKFTIVFPSVKDVFEVTQVAETILKSLSKAYQIEGHEFFLSASISIALHHEGGEDVETLLMNADKAMFYAKGQGKNNYYIYHDSMIGPSLQELELETDLHHALDSNEFFLCYQPQFVLGTNRMIGVEALIRWKHSGKLVPPDRFIPVVEANGLIIDIGRWVLYTACKQNKVWQDGGYSPMVMAVNVSAQQFQEKNFLDDIDEILSETGLDPKYLELEITERLLMHREETIIDKLIQLRAKGIKISIDDFGTGYSSLSYLKQFPINKLKIDQSFVRNLTKSFEDTAITTAIIAMGHSLNLKVVAEGIEEKEQLDFLHKSHCDEGQGYYFSRPLSVQDFSHQLDHPPIHV